jgi:hypothetical protein
MRRELRQSPPSELSERDQATQKRFVDELMDHYVGWREACAAVASAYDGYQRAERPDRRLAFSAYVAALDREAEAAAAYEEAVVRIEELRRLHHGVR